MKVYKVTLMHIDFDGMGLEQVRVGIENARMGNHVHPGTVMSIEEADIGEWDDEHPLNQHKTQVAAFQNLFKDPAPVIGVRGEREFYDLMQVYRTTPLTDQKAVTTAYEAVKTYLRSHRV